MACTMSVVRASNKLVMNSTFFPSGQPGTNQKTKNTQNLPSESFESLRYSEAQEAKRLDTRAAGTRRAVQTKRCKPSPVPMARQAPLAARVSRLRPRRRRPDAESELREAEAGGERREAEQKCAAVRAVSSGADPLTFMTQFLNTSFFLIAQMYRLFKSS